MYFGETLKAAFFQYRRLVLMQRAQTAHSAVDREADPGPFDYDYIGISAGRNGSVTEIAALRVVELRQVQAKAPNPAVVSS